jgi:putative peptidoglycan lipid II flippase
MAVVNPPRPDGTPPEPYRPRPAAPPLVPETLPTRADPLLPPPPADPARVAQRPVITPAAQPAPVPPAPVQPLPPDGPDEPEEPDIDVPGQPVLSGFAPLVPGQLLAERYRLVEKVGRERNASRWRATDENLGRQVLIYALEDEETADSVIENARQSTAATDARFVRVLDAVADADGFYIISEWVDGMTLAAVLQAGPLTALESAWVAKEVAEPLTTIHPLSVFHSRLDPTRVLITPSGDIRVDGLTTAAVLNPIPGEEDLSREELELTDVRDLGRLLYACQTAAWPGPEPVGLPEAPVVDGGYATPLRLQPAANATLDRITDQILSPVPRGGHPRLTTAVAVVKALAQVLGAADSADDLAHRLVLAANSPALTPDLVTGTVVPPVILPVAPTAEPSGDTVDLQEEEDPGEELKKRRPWSVGLVILAVVVFIAALSAVIIGLSRSGGEAGGEDPSGDPSATVSAPAGPEKVRIAESWAFDPFGSGYENDDLLALAYDGDTNTAWLAEEYPGPAFTNALGEPQAGVGLIVALGSACQFGKSR